MWWRVDVDMRRWGEVSRVTWPLARAPGLPRARRGAGEGAGALMLPQCWACLEELNKYLLSVPSTGGRELLGLRAFISGALALSLVGASGTEQVTTNISGLLPREMSRGGISIKNSHPDQN